MKSIKDTILEKLKIKTNASNFHIEKISSNANNVLNFMMRDIPFYEFEYEEYIKDILNSDIDICEKIKGELNSNFSNLNELLPIFLNIILTIMNNSKSDHIKYNIHQFVKKVNKSYKSKELFLIINYSHLGLDSERYILVFGAKGDDFTTDDILKLVIEKY
jgi:hypothetical protein